MHTLEALLADDWDNFSGEIVEQPFILETGCFLWACCTSEAMTESYGLYVFDT